MDSQDRPYAACFAACSAACIGRSSGWLRRGEARRGAGAESKESRNVSRAILSGAVRGGGRVWNGLLAGHVRGLSRSNKGKPNSNLAVLAACRPVQLAYQPELVAILP